MNEHNSVNPVVMVSGASSGIGEAICRLLVAQQQPKHVEIAQLVVLPVS
jgi:NAD(P)-dependent dehydrogenase (short-subunit alcohol dehydrogenase family)